MKARAGHITHHLGILGGHKNLPTSSFRVRNSSGCDRQDVPVRQRDRQSQDETTGGCLCGKLTGEVWPVPLFGDRWTPFSPEANTNQLGSQGCDMADNDVSFSVPEPGGHL